MDTLTPDQRRKVMQRIRSKNTKPEALLRKALWRAGIRYRKNYRSLPGTPDIAITKSKIAIFVDGDFWHARGHEHAPGEQIGTNKDFWARKLSRNIERDREVNDALMEEGWLVLRVWESEIYKDINRCVGNIMEYIQ